VEDGRIEDVYFVSSSVGWIGTSQGRVYRTRDGGATWDLQLDVEANIRSLGFTDTLVGWAGNLDGEDGDVLYATRNGGVDWAVIAMPAEVLGICGISVLNDTTVFAVGRNIGPAYLIATLDGGRTWTYRDMSDHAWQLVDVHFWSTTEGLAVGGYKPSLSEPSKAVVLYTGDGGKTWERRYQGSRARERGWKISFPTRLVGYVSVEGWRPGESFFLKSTDGGESWLEKQFWWGNNPYVAQGIGFVSADEGWIGSWLPGNPLLSTRDGGATWKPTAIDMPVNRLRFISDTLGYAAGGGLYKLDRNH
jgi:photosystem II stability/assembly factor-like uncharacterized protein